MRLLRLAMMLVSRSSQDISRECYAVTSYIREVAVLRLRSAGKYIRVGSAGPRMPAVRAIRPVPAAI